ncbi:MAG TPA: helix-turn-helix domain-containing protein [Pseudolabrys sp.]|jgi:CRP-like cAMP-binding protein|nr:helix-turn-helix domain-containing protein [Pseudolabrys sp.]
MLTQTTHRATPQLPAAQRQLPAASHALTGQIELMGATMPFTRNAEIYGENERAEYLYKLLSGSVRTYKVLNDGRRQIGAFYLPGDLFGLEVGENHMLSAEAIVDCKVLVIKRSSLIGLAMRDPEIARKLWTTTACELQRAQDHIMLLIKTARERVAGFLLEMSARSAAATEVDLPMSRQDIADYLGLTIETVSRTLTQLENAATIAVPTSRRIVLRNRGALSRLNS